MAINPKSFAKRTRRSAVIDLLRWVGVPEEALAKVEGASEGDDFATAVLDAIREAGGDAHDRYIAAIDQIEQLQDDVGFRALRSVAVASGITREAFDDVAGDLRAAAIMVMLRDARDFERALASNYADRYRQGRSWSGFSLGDPQEMRLRQDQAARRAFEDRLRSLFSKDALGGRCQFDWFDRAVQDPVTGEVHRCLQATVYAEERPRVEARIGEGGEVLTETRRPVVEAAIVFDRASGHVDVVAKGGRVLHQEAAALFAQTMLEGGDVVEPIVMRALDLDRLAENPHFEIRVEDGVRSAEVEQLTLVAPDGGITVSLATRASVIDEGGLHDRAAVAFGSRSPLVAPGWRVVGASIRVIFEPETEHGRPKSLLVTLSAPNRSNLRDQTERHRLVAHRLMARWGLYAV